MEEQQTQKPDSSEQENKDEAQVEETEDLEELFDEEGQEDVVSESDVENLSLEELNNLAGRKDNPFKSKEDFQKHYSNLKSFVGKKKEKEEEKPQKVAEDLSTKEELAQLKKDLAREKFLSNQPTAEDVVDVVEAYAEKNNITLDEAWESKFTKFADAGKKTPVNTNRIAPAQSKRISQLAEKVRTTDSDDAKVELVKEYFK